MYIGNAAADIKMEKNAQVLTVSVITGAVGRHQPEMLTRENPDYLLDASKVYPILSFLLMTFEKKQLKRISRYEDVIDGP